MDLFLLKQGLDTRMAAGKAMFQMMGVFAEFERSIIQERVRAGLARARSEGKRLGRPTIAPELEAQIKAALAKPDRPGVRVIAEQFGVEPRHGAADQPPFRGKASPREALSTQMKKGPRRSRRPEFWEVHPRRDDHISRYFATECIVLRGGRHHDREVAMSEAILPNGVIPMARLRIERSSW